MEFLDDEEVPILDPEDIIEIDTDSERAEALKYASALIENLTKIYSNDELMKDQPNLKTHIDTELDSLANLITMRESDKLIHDMIVRGIGKNPANAALYANLVRVQQSAIKLQQQIDVIVDRLKKSLKTIQLEINFNKPEVIDDDSSSQNEIVVSKGSKSFISQMQELNDNEF